MARVLAEGTGAEWSQVWLVVGDRPRLAATWPPEATRERAPETRRPGRDEVAGRRSLRGAARRRGPRRPGRPGARAPPAHDGRGTPVRGAGQAGRSGPARGPAARAARAATCRAVGSRRRAAQVAGAAGRPAGRRAPAARARHPRRRPAAPGRARREPAPRRDPGRSGRRSARTSSSRARCRPPSTRSTPWSPSLAASTRPLLGDEGLAAAFARRPSAPAQFPSRSSPTAWAGTPRRSRRRRTSACLEARAERRQALRTPPSIRVELRGEPRSVSLPRRGRRCGFRPAHHPDRRRPGQHARPGRVGATEPSQRARRRPPGRGSRSACPRRTRASRRGPAGD